MYTSRPSFYSRFQKLSLGEKQLISLLFFLIAYLIALYFAVQGGWESVSRQETEVKKLQKSLTLSELEYLFYKQEILNERIDQGESHLKDDFRETNNTITSLIESTSDFEEAQADTSLFLELSIPAAVIKHRWQDILSRAPDLPNEARYLLKEQFITMLRSSHRDMRPSSFQTQEEYKNEFSNFELTNYVLPDIGNKLEQLFHSILLQKKDSLPFILYDLQNLKTKLLMVTGDNEKRDPSETKNPFVNEFLTSLDELTALTLTLNNSKKWNLPKSAHFIEKIERAFTILYQWQQTITKASESQALAHLNKERNRWLISSVLLIVSGCLAFLFFYFLRKKTLKASLSFYSAMNSLKEGDFNASLKESSEKDLSLLAKTFNQMAENVRNLVAWFQQTGIQLTSSTTEITATAKEQEATLVRQEKTTRHIALAARTISITAKELARMMNEINGSAEATSSLASSGKKELLKMEEVMKQLVEASSNISAKLAVLNEKANTITNVISTIAKVADQTNLLSLNAAIEAEKAGEHGRSFSVIAREIRRLADQTGNATLDIEKMVNEMMSAVSAGVIGVDKFSLEIHEGAGQLALVSEQLSKIIEQVEQQTLSFEAVNHGMQEQSQNAEKINASIEELSLSVEQTTHSIKQFHKAIEEQHIAIKTMQRYRTDRMTEKPATV